MFTVKVLLNHLNPFLKLHSVSECRQGVSSDLRPSRKVVIRHNGKRYEWRVK